MHNKYLQLLLVLFISVSAGAQNVSPDTYPKVNKGTNTNANTNTNTRTTTTQTITATSTAAECVKFIESKVQKLIGQPYYFGFSDTVVQAWFTGGKSIIHTVNRPSLIDDYSAIYQMTQSGINWACFRSFYIEDFKHLAIAKIVFNASCKYTSQFNVVDVQTKTLTRAYPAYFYDTLTVYFHSSQKPFAADLEKAFVRLSQIAKEKGDIFNTNAFKPKVIEGKPGFKETVEFIQDNFPKELYYYGYTKEYNDYHSAELKKKDIIASMIAGTDSMCVSWYEDLRIPVSAYSDEKKYYRQYSASFSIKDIESIEAVTWLGINGFVTYEKAQEANFPTGIRLNATKGKSLIQLYSRVDGVKRAEKVAFVDIPFGSFTRKDNMEAVRNEIKGTRMFKAFNHLRNLCGAPEPLEF